MHTQRKMSYVEIWIYVKLTFTKNYSQFLTEAIKDYFTFAVVWWKLSTSHRHKTLKTRHTAISDIGVVLMDNSHKQDCPLCARSSALLSSPKINPFDRVSDSHTHEYSWAISLLFLMAHTGMFFCWLAWRGDQWISSNLIWLNQTNLDRVNQSHSLYSEIYCVHIPEIKAHWKQQPTLCQRWL